MLFSVCILSSLATVNDLLANEPSIVWTEKQNSGYRRGPVLTVNLSFILQ